MRLFRGIFFLLFFGTLVTSSLLVASTLYLNVFTLASGVASGAFLVALAAPRLAIALALGAIPLGGNRPGTTHASVTIVAGSALILGLLLRRWVSKKESLWNAVVEAPLLTAGFIYCLISLVSLSSIPVTELLNDYRNIFNRSSLTNAAFAFTTVLSANEHTLVYSVSSVYLTLLSYLLGILVFQLCKESPLYTPRIFLGAILSGLLLSLTAGLLDYYSYIDLLPFRELDPIVNQGSRQFRLQSFFAHSGWYAEYLTLAIPTALTVLSCRMPLWARTAILVAILALGEFVLILTYQRGGWLSYPITLMAMWAAIYVVRCLERQQTDVFTALKQSMVKVCVSLPITVAISLGLVFLLQGGESATQILSPYVTRFKDIQRTGDRSDFIMAGMLIGSKHPIMGAGSDSFAWQFEREFESRSGSFAGRYTLPLHGSAHNVFAQTFSGKGLCGLVALLSLPALLLGGARRTIINQGAPLASKLIALTGACFACAFLVYGNVQEVFYVQSLQFFFFAVIAIVASVLSVRRVSQLPFIASPLCILCLGVLHLAWEFVWPAPGLAAYKGEQTFGCYPTENSPVGSFRWCGEHATVVFTRPPAGNPLSITLEAGPLGQEVILSDKHEPSNTLHITMRPGERKTFQVSVASPPTQNAAESVVITFQASTSFVPALLWGSSTDSRRLAYKLIDEP